MAIKYLKKYGLKVVENGYDICFIRPGEKRPFGNDWESKKHGPKRIASAIENGRGGYGVGIKTRETVGVDIDCYNPKVVKHMVKATQALLGKTIQRIGFAPKTLLVYRADEPFGKVQSKTFIDDEGRAVKFEVLADGQQFVAFHIHPDTHLPYEWVDGVSVLDVPHDELEVITRDDALELAAEFERMARKQGWAEKTSVKRLGGPASKRHDDDPFASDKAKVDLTDDALLKKLHMVPNAEDYEMWFHIGMALYHQFDGGQVGLDMWHEWSANAPNYDMDALDEKWATFEIEGKKREPITARFILKQAKEEESRLSTEELAEIKEEITKARDDRDFQAVMDRIKHIPFPPITREGLVNALKVAIKKRTDSVMPVGTLRRAIAFENPEHKSAPAWLRHWVYIQQDDTFYNSKTRQVMTTKGFDLTFGRYLLTKRDLLEGITVPEHSATHVAVHRFQIPSVANKMYAPNEDEFFEANKLTYVNSYSDASVPEDVPEHLTPKQLKMCQRVERHLEHLFAVDRDRKLLLSWLAYIVQTGGKINWSPVVQGTENDGKSFFGRVMAAVLGGENVNVINGDQLAEQYTPWAEGSQFVMVEEVRLHGQDRFAVINKIKPYVANDMVTIRRMRTDSYKVINTVNYFLTTNHKDGVPVTDNSTRYFPMFSNFQTGAALDKFNAANPDYYAKLHEVLEHPGWLRRWLLDYELHEEFNPVNRATKSASLAEMKFLNQTEEDETLSEILDKEEPGVERTLLDSSALGEAMADAGVAVPYGRAWKQMLSEAGFTYLGVVKVEGKARKFWSQEPQRFRVEKAGQLVTDTQAIRDYLEPI